MERKDTFENELTEEGLPSGAKREEVAQTERLDPDVDSQAGDAFVEEDEEGA